MSQPCPGRRRGSQPTFRVVACVLVMMAAVGCRQDMHDAPRYDPLESSVLFADGRSSRDPLPGTIARGHLNEDPVLAAGKTAAGAFADTPPFAVDRALLLRGQERFNIFCTPCHSQLGDGNGMIVQRGYKQPQSFHQDRLRQQPLGYFVDVMNQGFGQMPSYAAQVPPKDRWAIAAYIRALQVSQNVKVAELSAAESAKVEAGATEPAHQSAGHGGSHE